MITSDYISNNNAFDEKVFIGDVGVTSLSYRVSIDGRQYFMKQLRSELFPNQGNRALFHKEYELGKKIESPYVVKYYDICESDDRLYILMEYVQGVTVDEKLTKEKGFFANEQNLWKFTLQLLEGLKAFHSNGIAYVDVSPNNIMLTQIGNNVKIVDLGFCFSNEHCHILGGTKNFTAPELNNKAAENIDERTDIYAVGCLLRYIKQRTGAKYSRNFYRIVKRCTRNCKEKRYATIDEMILAIKNKQEINIPNQTLEYVYPNDLEVIYLLDNNDYLSRQEISASNKDIISKSIDLIESLAVDGKKKDKISNGFKPIIPKNTKVLDIELKDKILTINFSKELNNIKEEYEEKLIESLTYTLTSIKGIDKIEIYIDGNKLTKLPNSKKELPEYLDKNYGINKK